MEYGYIHKFAGDTLKYWRLPLFFFIVFFAVAWYAANQKQARYCDEALVILGTVRHEIMFVDDPYVSAALLNVAIAGTDSPISGTVKTNPHAFEFSTRRTITISLKGKDPKIVRVALKNVLGVLASSQDEKYALAMAAYVEDTNRRDERQIHLKKMISNLSADKTIPVEAYENLENELISIGGPQMPIRTRITIPQNAEAKLCETKSALEMLFFSLSWGFIGSLMAMFGLHIWTTLRTCQSLK
jgi:hypothetical protein